MSQLQADTDRLRTAAAQLQVVATDLQAFHQSAHSKISGLTGFGPAATAALADLVGRWEEETNSHHADLMGHHDSHLAAAGTYEVGDANARQRITAAGSALG